ncbi:MAG: hypothetical protein ACP5E5_13975 [Acidobacteriaceae bacterium]
MSGSPFFRAARPPGWADARRAAANHPRGPERFRMEPAAMSAGFICRSGLLRLHDVIRIALAN